MFVKKYKATNFNNLIFYFSFIISLVSVFIFSIQGVAFFLSIKKVLWVMVPFIMGLYLLIHKEIKPAYLICSFIFGIYFYFTKRWDAVAEYILLSWIYFSLWFSPQKRPSDKALTILGFILCLIVSIHFYFFDRYGRESIGGLDPNYSSFLIFLLLPFAMKLKSKSLHVYIFTLGLLTQSRAFLLAYMVYLAFYFLREIRPQLKIQFHQFMWIFIILFILLMLYSYWGYSIGSDFYVVESKGISRMFEVFRNSSDFQRWKANILYLKFLSEDTELLFQGYEPLAYLKNKFKYLPHNLPLLEFATHGLLLGSVYIYMFFYSLKKSYFSTNYPFFMGIIIYWLFLGIEIGAIYNIMLLQIFALFNMEKLNA